MTQPLVWGAMLKQFRLDAGLSLDGMADAISKFTPKERAVLEELGADISFAFNKKNLSEYETGKKPDPPPRRRFLTMIYCFYRFGKLKPYEANQWLHAAEYKALEDYEHRLLFDEEMEVSVSAWPSSLVRDPNEGGYSFAIPWDVLPREVRGVSFFQHPQQGLVIKVVAILLVIGVAIFMVSGQAIVETLKNIFNRPVSTPEILEQTPVSRFTLTPSVTDVAETATPTVSTTPARSSTPRASSISVTLTPAAPAAVASSGTATQTVPTPFNVTNSKGQLSYPNIAVDDEGILHLAWKDTTPDNGPGPDILLRERQPDISWSDTFTLTSDFDSLQPFLKFVKRPDGVVCLFWEGATNNANPLTLGLYQSCYVNEEWTQAELIQNQPTTAVYDPVFAPDGSVHNVYVVPSREVRVGGANLADGAANVDSARMAIDQAGGYHIIWRRNGDPPSIEYRFSSDGGANWSAPQSLSDAVTEPATYLWLETDKQGFLHLFWTSQGRVLCYRLWKPESGWGDIETIKVDSDITSYGATLDDEGQIYVYWANKRYEVMYIQRQIDGSWTQPQVIASGGKSRPEPAMAVDADGIKHLFWRIKGETTDYFYAEIP